MSTSIAEVVKLMNAGIPQIGCTQEELDDCGRLLDRLEELEIFFNAPSISEQDREDTWAEMESVMERIAVYAEKA